MGELPSVPRSLANRLALPILLLLEEGDAAPTDLREVLIDKGLVTKKESWSAVVGAVDRLKEDRLIEVARTLPPPFHGWPGKTIYRVRRRGWASLAELLQRLTSP